MASLVRNFRAKAALAFLFFVHLLHRCVFFWRPARGLRTFLSNYELDSVFSVSEFERRMMPHFQKCQACSLCTFSCLAIQEGKAPMKFEPKMIMLGFSRSAHEAQYAYEDWLPCIECDACSVICPNQVPIHEAVQLVLERRNQIALRN